MFFSKLGSELKKHTARYKCHNFGIQDGAFGSGILPAANNFFLPQKLICKKQRITYASQCKKGKKKQTKKTTTNT